MYLGILMKFDVYPPLFWDMDADVQWIEGAIIVPSKMHKHTLCEKEPSGSDKTDSLRQQVEVCAKNRG